MKKLMIALAAVAMAACSQAANVKWNSTVLMAPNADGSFSSTQLSKVSQETTPWSASVTLTFYAYDADSTSWKEIEGITASTLKSDSVSTKNGKVSATTAGYDFLYNTEYKYSAEYNLTYGGKEYTMSVDPTAFTQNKSTGDFTLNMVDAGKWSAVPEPTSGLLLLLGVAGLALRRRRA